MNFVLKMMNCVLKMMNLVLKMMKLVLKRGCGIPPALMKTQRPHRRHDWFCHCTQYLSNIPVQSSGAANCTTNGCFSMENHHVEGLNEIGRTKLVGSDMYCLLPMSAWYCSMTSVGEGPALWARVPEISRKTVAKRSQNKTVANSNATVNIAQEE